MEIVLGLLFSVAFLWMLIVGIQSEQWGWVIGMFFIFPLIFLYGILNWDRAKGPFLLSVGSIMLMFMFIDPASMENY